MVQFTTDLKRDPAKFALTKAEAAAMPKAGFRFSEFNTNTGKYT